MLKERNVVIKISGPKIRKAKKTIKPRIVIACKMLSIVINVKKQQVCK